MEMNETDSEPLAPSHLDTAEEGAAAAEKAESEAAPDSASSGEEPLSGRQDRKRIEEQLDALKRREGELRRALAIADHPDLADAVRQLEGASYAVARVENKMAQGLSKSEEKRRETVEKKLAQALEKRSELDAQIAEFEAELRKLGEERIAAFNAERREALIQLIASLNSHAVAFSDAGIDPSSLVPDLVRLMPEVQVLAEELVKTRDHAQQLKN